MHKVDLGNAIAVSPIFYRNFISYHRSQLGSPVNRTRVNTLLADSQSNVVLRRSRLKVPRTVFNAVKMTTENTTRGDWYLEFKTKRDYIAFVLKWSEID